jgi:hypothetical protein
MEIPGVKQVGDAASWFGKNIGENLTISGIEGNELVNPQPFQAPLVKALQGFQDLGLPEKQFYKLSDMFNKSEPVKTRDEELHSYYNSLYENKTSNNLTDSKLDTIAEYLNKIIEAMNNGRNPSPIWGPSQSHTENRIAIDPLNSNYKY